MPTSSLTDRTRFSPALGTFLLLLALNLFNYIDRYILPGELSLIQDEFHATRQEMGALTTAMFFVYMLASKRRGTLYTGSTSDLVRRIFAHKVKAVPGFTAKYGVDRLLWFERHEP